MSTALLLVSSVSVARVWADMVELRNGPRVEGTFKGTDDSAVRIEVDGREALPHVQTRDVDADRHRTDVADKIVGDREAADEPSLLHRLGYLISWTARRGRRHDDDRGSHGGWGSLHPKHC